MAYLFVLAGVRVCGPPTAGVVTERLPLPVPPGSIYWGVYALTTYTHDPDDDQATPTQDRDHTSDNTLRVRWHDFRDNCALGIEVYNITLLRLDSQADGPPDTWDVLSSMALHRGTTSALDLSFALEAAGLYRVRVCGMAVTGLSACAHSDGLYYDVTPPTRGELCVHAGSRIWCSSEDATSSPANASTSLTAFVSERQLASAKVSWYGFGDAESRIGGFRWAIGSAAGAADVRAWAHVGWSTTELLDSVVPIASVITVECINSVGLTTNATIDLIVDPTPPVVGRGALSLLPRWDHHRPTDVTFFTNQSSIEIAVNASRVSDGESPVMRLQLRIVDVEASLTNGAPLVLETLDVDPAALVMQTVTVSTCP